MHDLVQVVGRIRDVSVLPDQPLEVGRDPVRALLLARPLRYVEDPVSRHSDWQYDHVKEFRLGQGLSRFDSVGYLPVRIVKIGLQLVKWQTTLDPKVFLRNSPMQISTHLSTKLIGGFQSGPIIIGIYKPMDSLCYRTCFKIVGIYNIFNSFKCD